MKKTVVLFTGDKGGVGKSFTARIFADLALKAQVEAHLYDTDKANATFKRFFNEQAQCIDVDTVEDLDHLLQEIHEKKGLFLVDCAARTLEAIQTWIDEVDFFSLKKELNLEMTLMFLLGPEKDCVQILSDVVKSFKNHVNYVVIKNESKGKNFSIYENSNLRKSLLDKYNVIELSLPALTEKTALVLDQKNFRFLDAEESPELQIADRQRVKSYNKKTATLFEDVLTSCQN